MLLKHPSTYKHQIAFTFPGTKRDFYARLRQMLEEGEDIKRLADSQNIRFLSHLAGSGASNSPRKVVNDGRLDQALLAVMAKSYSNFFKNA